MSTQARPEDPDYPPGQQPTTQFSAPTQQFGKIGDHDPAGHGPSKLPMYPERRGGGCSACSSTCLASRRSSPCRLRLPGSRGAQRQLAGAGLRRHRRRHRGAGRRRRPAAQADAATWRRRRGRGAGLPARAVRGDQQAERHDRGLGALPPHRVHAAAGRRGRRACCCSTRASSPRRRPGPSTSSRSTASTPARTTVSTPDSRSTVGRARNSTGSSSSGRATRRRTAGRISRLGPVDRRVPRGLAVGSADPAHRVPDLRPAAVEQSAPSSNQPTSGNAPATQPPTQQHSSSPSSQSDQSS